MSQLSLGWTFTLWAIINKCSCRFVPVLKKKINNNQSLEQTEQMDSFQRNGLSSQGAGGEEFPFGLPWNCCCDKPRLLAQAEWRKMTGAEKQASKNANKPKVTSSIWPASALVAGVEWCDISTATQQRSSHSWIQSVQYVHTHAPIHATYSRRDVITNHSLPARPRLHFYFGVEMARNAREQVWKHVKCTISVFLKP